MIRRLVTLARPALMAVFVAFLVHNVAMAADTIKLGVLAELSGVYQSFGIPVYNGIRLAVKEINDAGGVTVNGKQYQLDLLTTDEKSDLREASAATIDLVSDKKVKYIFGGIANLAPIVMQITEANKAIYFTTSSAAAAQIDKTKYMVLTVPPVATRLELSAKGIKQIFPEVKKIAMLMTQDATADEMLEPQKRVLTSQGFEITTTEMLPSQGADPSAQLTRIRATKPDLIFVGSGTVPVNNTVRTNKEIDAAPRYFSVGIGCTDVQKAGLDRPFASNTYVGANIENPVTPKAKDLAQRYKAFVGTDKLTGAYSAIWYYDFVHLLAKAFEKAGTFDDPQAVLAAMHEITYEGVSGNIHLDDKNRAVFGFDFCEVANATDKGDALHIDP